MCWIAPLPAAMGSTCPPVTRRLQPSQHFEFKPRTIGGPRSRRNVRQVPGRQLHDASQGLPGAAVVPERGSWLPAEARTTVSTPPPTRSIGTRVEGTAQLQAGEDPLVVAIGKNVTSPSSRRQLLHCQRPRDQRCLTPAPRCCSGPQLSKWIDGSVAPA
jgi:hypothetical protein